MLEHNCGGDQFFPWVTIDTKGNLNVTFHDRRNDTDSPAGAGAWPTSKTEVGNYLVWYWGGTCKITQTRPSPRRRPVRSPQARRSVSRPRRS